MNSYLKKNKLAAKWLHNFKKKKNKLLKATFIGSIKRNKKIEKLSLFDLEIKTKENIHLKRALLLQTPSVVIVPVIKVNNKKRFLVVKQFRIGTSEEIYEFPAGAMDNGNVRVNAMRELFEETGIKIEKKDLKPLNFSKPIRMMASYTNISAYFFYIEKKVTQSFIRGIKKKKFGCYEDGEYIKVGLMTKKELQKISTSSIVIGLSLYERI